MMEPWQAIYDEYPSGALDFGVIRGEDRSTLAVLSCIAADDLERLNSNAEFERCMAQALDEAKFRNAEDEAATIAATLTERKRNEH